MEQGSLWTVARTRILSFSHHASRVQTSTECCFLIPEKVSARRCRWTGNVNLWYVTIVGIFLNLQNKDNLRTTRSRWPAAGPPHFSAHDQHQQHNVASATSEIGIGRIYSHYTVPNTTHSLNHSEHFTHRSASCYQFSWAFLIYFFWIEPKATSLLRNYSNSSIILNRVHSGWMSSKDSSVTSKARSIS